MADSVTVSSHHSYGSRVGNSLKAIVGGIILVIVSIILLVWNENNYVKTKAALKEGAEIVQEADANQINSELEGSEIHVSGETASDAEALKDEIFGVTTDNLKLKRTVEMYQWYEESREECHDNYGGSEDCETTYTYDTKWEDEAIDSSSFYSKSGHENPSTREYESDVRVKEPINLGAYTLADIFVNQLTDYKTINLSEQNINIPEKYKLIADQDTTTQTNETTTVEDNNNSYLYGDSEDSNEKNGTTSSTTASNEKFHINGNQIYIGADPTNPAVGDLKITFSSVRPGTISVIGKQMNNELTSYKVSNGRNINLLSQGNVSAEDMFIEAQKENKMITWLLRLLGLILMYCGFSMLFQFIVTLAKVLPFLSNIIGVGTGIVALGLTLVVGFVTIGIAWLAVRPIVGICCLVVAASGIFLLAKSKKDKKITLEEKLKEKAEMLDIK